MIYNSHLIRQSYLRVPLLIGHCHLCKLKLLLQFPQDKTFHLCKKIIFFYRFWWLLYRYNWRGSTRPKYIFNKCGTKIYFFFTLQRFGPSPSPNFKKKSDGLWKALFEFFFQELKTTWWYLCFLFFQIQLLLFLNH